MEYQGPNPAIGDRVLISHGQVGGLDRGLRRIQSQRSFFHQPTKKTPFAVSDVGVDNPGSDSRKLMLASLGVSFRRTTKIGTIDPLEDITETACSTTNCDFDGIFTNKGHVGGAVIEEASPAVCSEDRRSRVAKKVGSFRKLQGVSFRRARSKCNVMVTEESRSANLEEKLCDMFEERHISIPSLAGETGTDTLGKLGWSLRRPETCSTIETSASTTSGEERSSVSETSLENSLRSLNKTEIAVPDVVMKVNETHEAIEDSSEGAAEDFITPIKVINEHPSKFHDRLQLDKVGAIEICRPKKSIAVPQVNVLDANVPIKETDAVLQRKNLLKTTGCSISRPTITEDHHFHIEKNVYPPPIIRPLWPTADGIDPLSKVLALDEYPARRSYRGKLKRSGSGDSSLGSSFKRMLSFRTFDSKLSSGAEESNRQGIAQIRSRLSACTSIRGLKQRPSAVNSETDVNQHAEQGIKDEVDEGGACKSNEPRGRVIKPENLYASKTDARKAILPLKEKTRSVTKKTKSLQMEHEGMADKSANILERKALLSRLARRAVSFPVPRHAQDKTVVDDDEEEEDFLQDAEAAQLIPDVVVASRDAMSTVSTLGYSAVPGAVEYDMLDEASVVSSLGKSKYRTISIDTGDKVPPVIDCLEADELHESLDFSISASSS